LLSAGAGNADVWRSGSMPKKASFYAVARGRTPGLYNSWAECEQRV
jgi:hypothetical protein